MRLCLIGPTYPYRGGIAHYTTLLARHLRAAGHQVLLISFARQYPRWLYAGKSDRDPSLAPLQTEAEYLLDPLNPLSWWRVLRRLQEWPAERVIIPWWVPFWLPAWFVLGRGVKRLQPKPGLTFICHNVLPHEPTWLDRPAVRLALAAADGCLVHSQAGAAELSQLLPKMRLAVAPLPTYQELGQGVKPLLPFTLPSDRPVLLFCGLVRPYKGLDILLDALPLVLVHRPVHLLIAGQFWQDEQPFRQQISRLGLEGAVTIHNGYLPDELLAACVQAAEVLVLPYRSASQSAIVQLAFGHTRPVITTNVGGLAEAVSHEKTGLIVPAGHRPELAAAINRFFDEQLGPIFRANIIAQQDRFSWEQLIQTLLSL